MNKSLRKNCIINSDQTIDHAYTFKNFPILMSCVDTDVNDDLFSDMQWGISSAGHLQLLELLDPNLIYKNYHTTGMVGKIWAAHHEKFANFIKKDNFYNVLEIGGGNGILAGKIAVEDKRFNWTIVEPSNLKTFKDSRIHHVPDFFESYEIDKKFDTIVHSHCFEHCYDPLSFLKKTHDILKLNGLQYISIPNMRYWLENKFTNTLSFEHTFYVDHDVLCSLLEKSGFEIIESIIDNHSIFVKAKKVDKIICTDRDFSYIKNIFENYISDLTLDTKNIVQKIENNQVYMFGAHIFTQVLLNLGLPENRVISILDNDVQKIGKRLYGTNLVVQSPICLKDQDSPIVILRAGSYNQEIQDSLFLINPSIIFV